MLFVALIPLFWALQGKSLKTAFGLGFLAGLARYVVLLYWIVYVTHVHGFLPLPLAIGILLLLAAYLSLYPALWALGVTWGEARGLPCPRCGESLRPADFQLTGIPVFRCGVCGGMLVSQAHKCRAEGKDVISVPISATMISAVWRPTPGIVSKR